MQSIVKVLKWLYDNWSAVVIIIGLLTAVIVKLKAWSKLSADEKLQAANSEKEKALTQLKQLALSWVTVLEEKWSGIEKSGYIKKSEFFERVYDKLPVLSQYSDEIEQTVSDIIDGALIEMRDILSQQPETKEELAVSENADIVEK